MIHAAVLAVLVAAGPAPELVEELRQFTESLRPGIDTRLARRLAAVAADVGQRQGLDPRLLLAIARVESNLNPDAYACWQRRGAPLGVITCDHGLMQINGLWVEEWSLDPVDLRFDLYLNVWTAARLLVKLRKEFGDEPNWFGRYHSNNPKKRAVWEARLLKWYSP